MPKKDTDKFWITIKKELLKVQDIETVVLKSHLLIETQINAALELLLNSNIDAVRLSFVQKLDLLACIDPTLKKERYLGNRNLYQSWKEFNAIRNKIAHQLSPKNKRKMLIDWATKGLGYKLKTINRATVLRRNIINIVVYDLGFYRGAIEVMKIPSNRKLLYLSRVCNLSVKGGIIQ